ncbi:MAG: hypothetical protein Q4D22_01830 [Candidatus Saccharibacteria bacterium]|nr:hypothetical protein [Candidatus Saccharibacteria bacterium]
MDSKGISAIAFAVILILAAGVFGAISSSKPGEEGDGKAQVNVLLVPESAKVKIGDSEYGSGNFQIDVGTYDATIFADGFTSKNVTLEVVEDGDNIVTFYNYLEPTSSYSDKDKERLDLIRNYL